MIHLHNVGRSGSQRHDGNVGELLLQAAQLGIRGPKVMLEKQYRHNEEKEG
jgi:hypothetical protein